MGYERFFAAVCFAFVFFLTLSETTYLCASPKVHHFHITYTDCNPEIIRSSFALTATVHLLMSFLFPTERMEDLLIRHVQEGYSVFYLLKETGHVALHVINSKNTVHLTLAIPYEYEPMKLLLQRVQISLCAEKFTIKKA